VHARVHVQACAPLGELEIDVHQLLGSSLADDLRSSEVIEEALVR
jgi:hypothetical protein